MLHGLTMTVLPRASGEGATNVDCVTRKSHEPKLVVPLAELPPEAIENEGVVEVLVNANVVGATVPNSLTPDGNAKEVFTTAAVIVGDTASVVSAVATRGGALPPPPPQATRVKAARKANMRLKSLFTE